MTGDRRYIVALCGVGCLVAAVVIRVEWDNSPARGAADKAAVVTTATPVPWRSKPVEYAPPVSEVVPGDGTWVVGREIKRGTYRTVGGLSCSWARLQGGPGGSWFAETPGYRFGPQVVVLDADDVVFASRGCGRWVMTR